MYWFEHGMILCLYILFEVQGVEEEYWSKILLLVTNWDKWTNFHYLRLAISLFTFLSII